MKNDNAAYSANNAFHYSMILKKPPLLLLPHQHPTRFPSPSLAMLRKAQPRASSASKEPPSSSYSRGEARLELGQTWVLFLVEIPLYDFVVAACLDGKIRVYNAEIGRNITNRKDISSSTAIPFRTFPHHQFCVNGMVLLQDDVLASVDTAGSLITWKVSTGQVLGRIRIYGDFMGPVTKLNSSLLAVGTGNDNIILVQHEAGRNLGQHSSLNNNDNNRILNMDSFNDILVTVSLNNRTCVWNYPQVTQLSSFVHQSLARSVIINKSHIIIGCDDGKIHIRRNDPREQAFPLVSIVNLATITGLRRDRPLLDHQMTLAFITDDLFMANTKTKGIVFISLAANQDVHYLRPDDAYGSDNKLISAVVLNDKRICVGGNAFCRIIKPQPKLELIIQESLRKYGKPSDSRAIILAKPHAKLFSTGWPSGAEMKSRGESLKRRSAVDANEGEMAKKAKLGEDTERLSLKQLEEIVGQQGKHLEKVKEELEKAKLMAQRQADIFNPSVLNRQNAEIDKLKIMAQTQTQKRKFVSNDKETEDMQKNMALFKEAMLLQKEVVNSNKKNMIEWEKMKAAYADLVEKKERMEEFYAIALRQDESIKLVAARQKKFSDNRMRESEEFQRTYTHLDAQISKMKAAIEGKNKALDDGRKKSGETVRLLKQQVEKLQMDVDRVLQGRKHCEHLQPGRATEDERIGEIKKQIDGLNVELDEKKKVEEASEGASHNWKDELDEVKKEFALQMKKTQDELGEQRESVSFLKNVVNMLMKQRR